MLVCSTVERNFLQLLLSNWWSSTALHLLHPAIRLLAQQIFHFIQFDPLRNRQRDIHFAECPRVSTTQWTSSGFRRVSIRCLSDMEWCFQQPM